MPFDLATLNRPLSENVKADLHTNGIESLCSTLKHAHKCTFHKMSPKHLPRHVQEFAGRGAIMTARPRPEPPEAKVPHPTCQPSKIELDKER